VVMACSILVRTFMTQKEVLEVLKYVVVKFHGQVKILPLVIHMIQLVQHLSFENDCFLIDLVNTCIINVVEVQGVLQTVCVLIVSNAFQLLFGVLNDDALTRLHV
jgi:hypothetical protein